MEINRNQEEAVNTKKFAFVIFVTAVLTLIVAILIPLFLLGQNVYFESFIRLVPSSGDFLLIYYAIIVMDALFIISNALIMLDYLFTKLAFRVKLLIIYSNAVSVSATLFLNSLMIWLDMWTSGGSGIILVLSFVSLYQVKLVSDLTASEYDKNISQQK